MSVRKGPAEVSSLVSTDAGMLAVWDREHFGGVVGYDTWAPELLEDSDILRHIEPGAFVPINIGGDGAWQVLVRIGHGGRPARMTDRESAYLVVSSLPYLHVSTGSTWLSAIEDVRAEPDDDSVEIPLTPGRYRVTIHLIDWESDPDSSDGDGNPAPEALPDFVVLVDPEGQAADEYRRRVMTFDRAET